VYNHITCQAAKNLRNTKTLFSPGAIWRQKDMVIHSIQLLLSSKVFIEQFHNVFQQNSVTAVSFAGPSRLDTIQTLAVSINEVIQPSCKPSITWNEPNIF
jgi:hypothetical protein